MVHGRFCYLRVRMKERGCTIKAFMYVLVPWLVIHLLRLVLQTHCRIYSRSAEDDKYKAQGWQSKSLVRTASRERSSYRMPARAARGHLELHLESRAARSLCLPTNLHAPLIPTATKEKSHIDSPKQFVWQN